MKQHTSIETLRLLKVAKLEVRVLVLVINATASPLTLNLFLKQKLRKWISKC